MAHHKFKKNTERDYGTYLFHIMQNYDSLADIILFLPGFIMHYRKKQATVYINNCLLNGQISSHEIFNNHNLISLAYIYSDQENLFNFQIDNYLSTDSSNFKLSKNQEFKLSDKRPLGTRNKTYGLQEY